MKALICWGKSAMGRPLAARWRKRPEEVATGAAGPQTGPSGLTAQLWMCTRNRVQKRQGTNGEQDSGKGGEGGGAADGTGDRGGVGQGKEARRKRDGRDPLSETGDEGPHSSCGWASVMATQRPDKPQPTQSPSSLLLAICKHRATAQQTHKGSRFSFCWTYLLRAGTEGGAQFLGIKLLKQPIPTSMRMVHPYNDQTEAPEAPEGASDQIQLCSG